MGRSHRRSRFWRTDTVDLQPPCQRKSQYLLRRTRNDSRADEAGADAGQADRDSVM